MKTSTVPRSEWPEAGKVEFDSYSVRYREGLDCVLKGITVSIQAGEKVHKYMRARSEKHMPLIDLTRCVNGI